MDELVETALRNNPAIQGAKETADTKHARVSAAETLPDPTLSFQTMGDFLTLQKGDPSSGRTYTVEQEIPFPGKLGLKGKIATAEAEAEDWNHETTRRQVTADVKVAYYDLYLIVKSIDSAEETRSLLHDFSKIAESKYRVGAGTQQDVIKAQLEVSKISDRLTVLEQRRGISEARIRNLTFDRTDGPLGKPADFPKAHLHYSQDQLERLAMENSPKLKTQEKIVFIPREDSTFEPRRIKTGGRVSNYYIVLEDLQRGEKVVTSGNFPIDSESQLKSALGGMTDGAPHAGHGGAAAAEPSTAPTDRAQPAAQANTPHGPHVQEPHRGTHPRSTRSSDIAPTRSSLSFS